MLCVEWKNKMKKILFGFLGILLILDIGFFGKVLAIHKRFTLPMCKGR